MQLSLPVTATTRFHFTFLSLRTSPHVKSPFTLNFHSVHIIFPSLWTCLNFVIPHSLHFVLALTLVFRIPSLWTFLNFGIPHSPHFGIPHSPHFELHLTLRLPSLWTSLLNLKNPKIWNYPHCEITLMLILIFMIPFTLEIPLLCILIYDYVDSQSETLALRFAAKLWMPLTMAPPSENLRIRQRWNGVKLKRFKDLKI